MCTCAKGDYDHCNWQKVGWSGTPCYIMSTRSHIFIPEGNYFKLILQTSKHLKKPKNVYVYLGAKTTIEQTIAESVFIKVHYIFEEKNMQRAYAPEYTCYR